MRKKSISIHFHTRQSVRNRAAEHPLQQAALTWVSPHGCCSTLGEFLQLHRHSQRFTGLKKVFPPAQEGRRAGSAHGMLLSWGDVAAEPRGHLRGTLSEQGTQPSAEHSRDEQRSPFLQSGYLQRKVWPKVASPPPCHRWDVPEQDSPRGSGDALGHPQSSAAQPWVLPAPESALVGFPHGASVISGWDRVMPSPFRVRGSSPGFDPWQEPGWEPGRVRADVGHCRAAPCQPLTTDPGHGACPAHSAWVGQLPPQSPVQGHPRPARLLLSLRGLWLSPHTEHRLCALLHRNQQLELSRGLMGHRTPPARRSVTAPRYCQQ